MPLDQAVYVPETGAHGEFIAAVRAGYVFKLSCATGTIQSYARYTAANFGPSGIAYDSTNDKLIVTAWNELRAADVFYYEATNRKGLFKINPATLALESFVADPAASTDAAIGGGPHRCAFGNDKFYFVQAGNGGIARINPSTLALDEVNWTLPDRSLPDLSNTGFCDLVYDPSGVLWLTSAAGQEVFAVDPSNLTNYNDIACGSTYDVVYDNTDLGTVTMTDINTPVAWSASFPANASYTATLVSGCLRKEYGVPGSGDYYYFLYQGHPLDVFDGRVYTDPGVMLPFILGGGGPAPFYYPRPFPFIGSYTTQAECEAEMSGTTLSVGPITTSSFQLKTTGVGFSGAEVIDPIVVQLTLNYHLVPSAEPPFNPYGTATDPWHNRLFIACRQNKIAHCTVSDPLGTLSSSAISWISLGDSAALPYRVRYNPADRLLYVPTLTTNKVVRINTDSLTVQDTKTGFDSPHDVVFCPATDSRPAKVFAVQLGPQGLRLIA